MKIFILLLLLLTRVAFGAIALDTAASNGSAGASPITWTHTVSGSNTILFVGLSMRDRTTTISAVTFNSVAMTFLDSSIQSGQAHQSHLYYLTNPDAGAHTISISTSSSITRTGCSISFTGVNQSAPLGTQQKNSGDFTTTTVDVSSAAGELVMDFIGVGGVTGLALTQGGGQTKQVEQAQGTTETGSISTEAGAGTVTMSWSWTGAFFRDQIAVPVKAAGGVPILASQYRRRRQ